VATLLAGNSLASTSEFSDIDCTILINEAPPGASCHSVTLPVDHFRNRSQSIELPLLIARANTEKKSQSAILIPGGGGPGSPVGFGYLYDPGGFLEYYQPLLDAGFDIVFTDQRGAGLSTPMLACEESIADFKRLVRSPFSLHESMKIQLASTAQCRSRLNRQGIDLTLFNTEQSAADFLAIIDALNYDQWHVLATSYATAIAQAMLLIRPDGFASVVLDSPVPLDYQQPLSQALVREGIQKTIDLCTRRKRCARRYPDLAGKFNTVLARAGQHPYKVKIMTSDDAGFTRRRTLVVDQYLLSNILFTALYSNYSIQQLPQVIDELHAGQVQALNPFAEEFWYQGVDTDYADGLYLSVHCRERIQLEAQYQRGHPQHMNRLDADSLTMLENQRKMCQLWQAGEDDKLNSGQVFDTPALLLAGDLDPIISSADLAHTANNFSNAQTLIEPFTGHAVWYQSECARQHVQQFMTGSQATVCEVDELRFD